MGGFMKVWGWAVIMLAALACPVMVQPAGDPTYDRTEREPDGSLSVGKYLFTKKAMIGLQRSLGLSNKTVFTPHVQDMMMVEVLRMSGLEAFKAGKISAQQFQHNLAVHLGSFADPATNASLYGRSKFMSTTEVQAMIAGLKDRAQQ